MTADAELVRLWGDFLAARNGLRDAPHSGSRVEDEAIDEPFYRAMDDARGQMEAIEPEGFAGVEAKLKLFWHGFAEDWQEHHHGASATSAPQERLLWSLIKRCEALAASTT